MLPARGCLAALLSFVVACDSLLCIRRHTLNTILSVSLCLPSPSLSLSMCVGDIRKLVIPSELGASFKQPVPPTPLSTLPGNPRTAHAHTSSPPLSNNILGYGVYGAAPRVPGAWRSLCLCHFGSLRPASVDSTLPVPTIILPQATLTWSTKWRCSTFLLGTPVKRSCSQSTPLSM